MAGYISNGTAIDYHDGEGFAVIGKRIYKWEFHEYCGPFFINKDGNPSKIQPRENHPVWPHFNNWLNKYKKARLKAKSHEIIKV
jgi:hypothetical protein